MIKYLKSLKVKKIILFFIISFFINSIILIFFNILSYNQIYNENFKLQWYKAYIENDTEKLDQYSKWLQLTYYKKNKECDTNWFSTKGKTLQFCNDKVLVKFKEKWWSLQDYIKKQYISSLPIIFILALFFLYYSYLLNPYVYTKNIIITNTIVNDIVNKFINNEDVRTLDIYKLKQYYIKLIDINFSRFYTYRKQVYQLHNKAWEYWLIEVQHRLKVLYKELSWIYLFKKKYWLKWLWNRFSYYSSRYLTSISIYTLFLLMLLIYDAFLFRYIFFITTWWTFDKSLLWYIYETVNITSNLWWNTDWIYWLQQLYLIYLTISWVALFWIFIAILNDKIKLQ